jgi:uncharacterized protein YigA (DUF484 family)
VDRPKDKTTQAEAAHATPLVRSVLGAADVAVYLRQNPDFLIEHSELLQVLTPPSQQRGERVVDMQHFMLQHLRAEVVKLKSQHRALVATSRANLASQARVHASVLALLAASSFEQLIQIVTTDLAVLLDADVVTIAVESTGPQRPRLNHQGVQILQPGTVDAVLGVDRDVVLKGDAEGDPMLFGDGAGLVRSAALLRLCVSPAAPAGLLCIGMRRPGKFHGGQGTELLSFLARALGITIAAWLDLPA